jgi:hypothetical protein
LTNDKPAKEASKLVFDPRKPVSALYVAQDHLGIREIVTYRFESHAVKRRADTWFQTFPVLGLAATIELDHDVSG